MLCGELDLSGRHRGSEETGAGRNGDEDHTPNYDSASPAGSAAEAPGHMPDVLGCSTAGRLDGNGPQSSRAAAQSMAQAGAHMGDTACEAHESQQCYVFVNTNHGTLTIDLDVQCHTMAQIQKSVHGRTGIPLEWECLMYGGKQPARTTHLDCYGLQAGATLHLLGDGASSNKRPRWAFEDSMFEDSMDVEAAEQDPLYTQWKTWLETCTPIATAFLPPEAKATEALGYKECATRQGLTEAGMSEMVHWAAPYKPDHEVLLALAAYEKAKPYKVDLQQGRWVEAPRPQQQQQPQGRNRYHHQSQR